MSENIFWVLELTVRDSDNDDMTRLMNDMVEATQASESGALNYEWHLSDDRKTCRIYERYADAAAVMAHLEAFGDKFADRFMSVFEPRRFNVFGKADGAVRAALTGMGAEFNETVGGFVRT